MQPIKPHAEQAPENPFLALKFYEFAAVSAVTLAFFPFSLALCWLAFGPTTTRQLIDALLKDFVQTLLILGLLIVTAIALLVYGVWQWVAV
ncbi:MAG: hypothetical protein ACO31Z_08420 [Litorivicinaceae bacterium]